MLNLFYSDRLSGSLVSVAWRVLRLQIEEKASRYGG
jgi:transposase